jgi:hypothetical protein
MSKTIISFDIGIKNLAYCVFSLPSFSVLAWDVVNLVPAVESTAPLCNCLKALTKTTTKAMCGKKATYTYGDANYCLVHSKNSGKLLPSKETSPPYIKKLKLDELLAFCEKHGIPVPPAAKKPVLVENAIQNFERRCLVPIVKPKTSNANQVHLVDIGKRIKMEFDERLKTLLPQITHVILENQISPIAGRMNTIQGMLSQYFIMRNETIHIEFISSIGKLKGLSMQTQSEPIIPSTEVSVPFDKAVYKEHKSDGIFFCKQFLENNPQLISHKQIIETSHKKDDLADSFLQGIYYMKRGNLISYNDKFQISILKPT